MSLPFRLSPSQLHPSKLTLHVHTASSVCVCVCVCVCARARIHMYPLHTAGRIPMEPRFIQFHPPVSATAHSLLCGCACVRTPAHCREDSNGTSLQTVSSACLCHCTFSYFKQFYHKGETSATTSTKAAEGGFWHPLPWMSRGKCRLIGE